jgi:hypothetical protein
MRYLLTGIAFFLCLHLLAGCSGDLTISGVGGQTTNGIMVAVVYPGGMAGAGLRVRVRPSTYLTHINDAPDSSKRSVVNGATDKDGHFRVDFLPPGSYIIEVNDGQGFAVAFERHTLDSGGMVDAGTEMLAPTGVVHGFMLPEELHGIPWYIQVYGLERIARVDSQTGAFTFSDLPQGNYTFRRISSDSTAAPLDISDIQVRSNDTTVLSAFLAWSHNAVLTLNTTASGVGISGNVYNFPVLVRLSSEQFDFSQAKADGGDVRFVKRDGTLLAREIERWDPVTGHAELWVRVDTVYGNDESQYIVMYWGNPAATDGSESAAVFDTAGGFQGVWHLSGPGNTTAFDATFNHYDGTPAGMSSASTAAGMIGQARAFDGFSSALSMPNTAAGKLDFPENGTYSMSLWAYADTIDTLWHAIAGKGHEQYYIQYKCFGNNKAKWEFVEYHDKRGWEVVDDSTAPGPKQWVYLVGVRSGSSQKLYVNGVLASEAKWIMPGTYARNTGDNFSLGRYERPDSIPDYQGWSYFKGSIDEVRVSSVAPTPDWIKLCYMNQKKQDVLLKW